VSRVDPATNQVIATVNVSREGAAGPNSVGRGGDSLWVAVSNCGEVLRIDPTTNRVQAPSPSRAPAARARNFRSHALARGRLHRCGHATQGLEASTLSPL
jgi:hypothetical protein